MQPDESNRLNLTFVVYMAHKDGHGLARSWLELSLLLKDRRQSHRFCLLTDNPVTVL